MCLPRTTFGLVAFLLNAFALSSLVGVEFVINLVFKDLPGATVQALRAGSLGIALTTASVLFLLGTLAFVAAMLLSREIPPAPLVLYAVGAIPVALRTFLPEVVLDLGLVVLAVGIAWLAILLLDRSGHIAVATLTGTPPRTRTSPSSPMTSTEPAPPTFLRYRSRPPCRSTPTAGASRSSSWNAGSCTPVIGAGYGPWPGSYWCSS